MLNFERRINLLEAHINLNHDADSLKSETIDTTIKHIFKSGALKREMKVTLKYLYNRWRRFLW
ncbi:MAG TPA: hypothetical protein VIK78_12470 [Ruminiclostridium sp.]